MEKNPGKKILNFLTIQPHTTASGTLARWFEEETGTQVNVTPVAYADISAAAIQDAQGAGTYDLFQYWYPMLGALVGKGVLRDISTWWEEKASLIRPDDFIPVFRDTWCLVDGHRYGVPYDGDMHLLFYNKPLFEKYHFQPPKTWDEYLEIARTITKEESGSGIYGCGIMAADIPLILIGTFLNRLAGFGGNFFDEMGRPSINSPQAVAALDHLMLELPWALPDATRVAFDEMLAPWMAGKVGMVEFWADLGKMTDTTPQSALAGKWGVVPLPKGPSPGGKVAAPLNAGWSLGVSTRSSQPELAIEFLEFCLRPDINLRIGTIQGALDPARWSVYDMPEYRSCITEEMATAVTSAVRSAAVPWPTDARWPELQDILHRNLYRAVTGQTGPAEALRETQSAWNAVLK